MNHAPALLTRTSRLWCWSLNAVAKARTEDWSATSSGSTETAPAGFGGQFDPGSLATLPIAGSDHHMGAEPHQPSGDLLADTTRRPGDHCDLAAHRRFHSPIVGAAAVDCLCATILNTCLIVHARPRKRGASMDVLSDMLDTVRLETTVFAQTWLRAPWGIRAEGRDQFTFHVLPRGGGCLEVDGLDPVEVGAGDVVMLAPGPVARPARPARVRGSRPPRAAGRGRLRPASR